MSDLILIFSCVTLLMCIVTILTMPINDDKPKLSQALVETKEHRRMNILKYCPDCGKKLEVRKTADGLITGCTNFPECWFVLGKN